jgi:beta-lactamase regulating signal transducer with metallopeptidase domain
VLATLLIANLAAAAAVLLVLVLRRPARAVLGARTAYALWLVVPVAMLASLLPARTVTTYIDGPSSVEASSLASAAIDPGAQSPMTPHVPAPAPPPAPNVAAILLAIWVAGATLSLAMLFVGHRRALGRFGRTTADAHDIWRAATPSVGPALIGLVRPRLIVPSDFESRFDAEERAMIIAHERIHLESLHALINGVAAITRAINWFNPLLYVGDHYARMDQELSCDASVIARFPRKRQAYAEALLKTQLGSGQLAFGCQWPGQSANMLEQRIEMLAKTSPNRLGLSVGGAVIGVITAVGAVAAYAAKPPIEETQIVIGAPAVAPLPRPENPVVETAEIQPAHPAVVQSSQAPQRVRPSVDHASAPAEVQPAPQAPPQSLPRYAPLGHKLGDGWAPVSISGTITDVKWFNPNVQIFVHGDDGKDWYVLTSTPNHVKRSGGSTDIIRKNVKITLDGQRAVDTPCAPLCVAMAWETDMTFNGAKLTPPAPLSAPNLQDRPQQQ